MSALTGQVGEVVASIQIDTATDTVVPRSAINASLFAIDIPNQQYRVNVNPQVGDSAALVPQMVLSSAVGTVYFPAIFFSAPNECKAGVQNGAGTNVQLPPGTPIMTIFWIRASTPA